MKTEPAPGYNEAARLAELAAYNMLDTGAEQAYDDITYLASRICGTPIALVSLVDTHRQWFKSKVGLEAKETSRDIAFCGHAIQRPQELFVVPDATKDDRFSSNPLVLTEPHIRFYAGAPLVTSAGNALGTLCVIDRVPREISDSERDALLALSRLVMAQMDLRISRDRAEAADRLKMLFLTNMSHEIRTPLNAIMGLSELMTIEALGPLGGKEYLEYASDINASGKHLLSLIEDILDMSRIEANELALTETTFELADPVEKVLRMVSLHAEGKGIRLCRDLPADLPPVYADERRMTQILINLVTNAIKFTPEHGTVGVSAVFDQGAVRLEISDTGIGMTEGEIETALTVFGQIANDLAVQGGSGLGLPISKRLVEAHDGSFRLQSEPGRGTTAVITLPPHRIVRRAA